MLEVERRDDLDVDPAPADVLDRVGDEAPNDIFGRARPRGGEDRDLHVTCNRRAKTTGAAKSSKTSA